jgi:hypothetical protein
MRKTVLVGLALILSVVFVSAGFAAESSKMKLKKGDEVYVCGCGKGCDCDTMAKKEGKCTCGKDLVKAKVTKVKGGKAYFMINGEEKGFKMQGKYFCACGAGCDCGTISQKPGKCVCGKDLQEVKAKKSTKSKKSTM